MPAGRRGPRRQYVTPQGPRAGAQRGVLDAPARARRDEMRRLMAAGELLSPLDVFAADTGAKGGLLNLGKSAVAGTLGIPMDLLQMMAAARFGAQGMRAPQLPGTTESIAGLLGADLTRPTGQVGQFGIPGVEDIARKAPGGILGAMTLIHGSPHRFNRFSVDHIGRGEGAQSYGYGLYFAENPEVAKGYAAHMGDGVMEIPGADLSPMVQRDLAFAYGASDFESLDDIPPEWWDEIAKELADEGYPEEAAKLRAADKSKARFNEGYIYEVDVDDQVIEKMLDWDSASPDMERIAQKYNLQVTDVGFKGVSRRADPYSPKSMELPPRAPESGAEMYRELMDKIRAYSDDVDMDIFDDEALGELGRFYDVELRAGAFGVTEADKAAMLLDFNAVRDQMEPDEYLRALSWLVDDENQAASMVLANEGIPGVRYLDGFSRKAGEGKRNFVLFNDGDINQVKRNGELVYGGLLAENPATPARVDAPPANWQNLDSDTRSALMEAWNARNMEDVDYLPAMRALEDRMYELELDGLTGANKEAYEEVFRVYKDMEALSDELIDRARTGAAPRGEIPVGSERGRLATPDDVPPGGGLLGPAPAPKDITAGEFLSPEIPQPKVKDRIGTTGKYRGAPRNVTSPQKLGAMRKNLTQLLEEGIPGRLWYDESSESIQALSGDLPGRTRTYGTSLAVTSPSMRVPENRGHAAKAYNQRVMGDPIRAGIFPNDMGERLEDLAAGRDVMGGPKTAAFYEAITKGSRDTPVSRATNDIWQARAFGYTDEAGNPWNAGLGAAQHRFIDKEMQRLVDQANAQKIGGFDDWTLERAQAALWVAQKARDEGWDVSRAAFNFGTDLIRDTATIAAEAMPAKSLNHLSGAMADPDARRALFEGQNRALTDDQGRDLLALHAGALTRPNQYGAGVYRGEINDVTKIPILAGTETGSQTMDPASARLARGIAAGHGLLKGQETTAIKFLRKADKPGFRSAAHIELDAPADEQLLQRLEAALDAKFGKDKALADFSEGGVDILSLDLDDAGDVKGGYEAFQKGVQQVVKEVLGQKPLVAAFRDSSAARAMRDQGPAPGLVGRFGEYRPSEYVAEIDAVGPEFAERIDEMMRWGAGTMERIDDDIARMVPDAGQRSEVLQTTRRALAEGGLERVRELVRQGVLPVAVLGVIGVAAQQSAGSSGAATAPPVL